MSKVVAILQSNYIPWKGYFDIVHDVDEFIFYDDQQYTKGDWRNRNLIKTPKGTVWLTVPVGAHHMDRKICEVTIENPVWQRKHWLTIQQFYRDAPHFARYRDFFEEFYLAKPWTNLSVMNQQLIARVAAELLGIGTRFVDSRAYGATGDRVDRLKDLLRRSEASTYMTGPTARNYLQANDLDDIGVALVWKEYTGYPEYPQFFGPFEHRVSILDLLFQM